MEMDRIPEVQGLLHCAARERRKMLVMGQVDPH